MAWAVRMRWGMETIVLLHCSGSSGAQWRSLAEKLSTRYRVIAPDLIGYGKSAPWSGEGEFSLAREAAALNLHGPVHLVGHSYGGGVALHIARTRPELIRTLTLIEPSAFHLLRADAADTDALLEIAGVSAQARAALASGDYLGGFGSFVDYWKPGSWAAMPAEKRAAFAPQIAKVALEFHALLNEPAGIEDMGGIAAPTLLLQGAETKLPSRCVCNRLRAALPGAEFRLVPGAGHMLPVTHRDEVNRLVAAHLDRASPQWQAAA
jgi:pimeloyl-ACP methyl ester carboxylesterase